MYDSAHLWVYLPKLNQYTVYDAPDQLPRDSRPEDADLYTGIGGYRNADVTFGQAHFLREETISIGGGKADCFVLIQDPPGFAATLWIDKTNYHVLRMSDNGGSMTVTYKVKLGEPISDDLFKFEPPPGARKRE